MSQVRPRILVLSVLCFLALAIPASAQEPCTLKTESPSVTICSPAPEATVGTSVVVSAGTTSANPVKYLQIWLDGVKVYQVTDRGTLDTTIPLTPGRRRITVQASDTTGTVFKSTIFVNAVDSGDPSTPPSGECAPGDSLPSVVICEPGTTATSPVKISAAAASTSDINLMQVWVDGQKKYEVAAAFVETSLAMAEGSHRLVVQARDVAGTWTKATKTITVSSSTPADCPLSSVSPSVTICTPQNNATVPTGVRVVAGTTSSSTVSLIQVYVDGVKRYQANADRVDTTLTIEPGAHRITVQAKNAAGTVFKSSVNVTVVGETVRRSPIEHIIIVQMQNHSFNNLFGYFPGANGISPESAGYAQKDASGNTVTPHLLSNVSPPDLPHSRTNYLNTWNQGAMDKFAYYHGSLAMGYFDNSIAGVDKLWGWAQSYALNDNYYSSVMSNAPANPLYMVSASDNNFPWSVQPYYGPCQKADASAKPFTWTNIGDQLKAAGVTWGWFQHDYGTCGTGYIPQQNPFQYFTSTHNSPNLQAVTAFYSRLENGTLPAVSYVQPAPFQSTHPGSGSITYALNWLDGFILRVQNSEYWSKTAIVIIWDEGGGWWDGASPPQVDSQGLGIRVPMIVISPYAKRGHVSHVRMDHVSILKFIQWNWSLQTLNPRNGISNDLQDMFDF